MGGPMRGPYNKGRDRLIAQWGAAYGYDERLTLENKIKLWDAVHGKDYWDLDEEREPLRLVKVQRQN